MASHYGASENDVQLTFLRSHVALALQPRPFLTNKLERLIIHLGWGCAMDEVSL